MDEMNVLITDEMLRTVAAGVPAQAKPHRSHTPEEKQAEELRRVAFGTSRRRPLTEREKEFAKALSVQPDKLPKDLPKGRVLKIIKEARRLWARRQELKRAGVPRQARALKRSQAARKARRVNR